MKIIIIEDSSKAWFGGGQKVTMEVARILKECYKLILFDCTKNSRFFNESKELFSDIFLLKCYGRIVGGRKSSFSIGFKELLISFFMFPLNLYSIARFLKKNLKRENIIIYAATKKGLLLSFFLKMFLGYRYIFHAHSFDDKKSLFYKIIKLPLKYSDNIICVSDIVKSNINLNHCCTVYNPITVKKHIKPRQIGEKVITASFSNLFKWKGIEYFMQSYDFLINKNKVEYWIFGDGEEKENLLRYQRPNVILKNFTHNVDDLMMNYISIIVLPSVSVEACPMVPLEAFSYGIPVITTNIGGQAEIVKDNYVGYHVPMKDPQAIAEKIDFLINNANIYHQMSNNALKYSMEFNIKKFHEQILHIFKRLNND